MGHPLCGHSWEGYCIEQIVTRLPRGSTFSHYRTYAGAEVDLIVEHPLGEIATLEIKRTLAPKLTAGFVASTETLQATTGQFIIPQGETFPLSPSVTAISFPDYVARMP